MGDLTSASYKASRAAGRINRSSFRSGAKFRTVRQRTAFAAAVTNAKNANSRPAPGWFSAIRNEAVDRAAAEGFGTGSGQRSFRGNNFRACAASKAALAEKFSSVPTETNLLAGHVNERSYED
jgi:hypothetical protein